VNQQRHILIVEDEDNLRLALSDNLRDEGYSVHAVSNATDAKLSLTEGEPPDLVLLDIMLPDIDGYTLCREWRAEGRDFGVLMLTARVLEDDILRGFEAGADDYLEKPYRLRVLLARVKALLRRGSSFSTSLFHFGEFKLDEKSRMLFRDSEEIQLTQKEFDLLLYLLRNEGRALSRDELLDSVWGTDVVVDTRTVDNFISNLKRKLRSASRGFQIQTVRGVGYRFAMAELLDDA